MLIKRLLIIIYFIFYLYSVYYLITKNFKSNESILNIKTKRFRNLKIHAILVDKNFTQTKLELQELSGDYEELPSIETIPHNPTKYTIENIYFLITTNTHRIRFTINFIKFWSKIAHINCLILFEEDDYLKRRSVHYFLQNHALPCQIKTSNITRYEERYFQLIDFAWKLIQNENQSIKWFAIGDDDTMWFIDNLLKTLEQYDSSKLIYLGNTSDKNETVQRHGNYYAYGGGGILLTKSLVSLLGNSFQLCRKKYSHMFGGDEMIGKCLTQILNVNLTINKHFHQIDHEGDMEGFFQSGIEGLVTLHHMFSFWEPFPSEHVEDEIDILKLIENAYRKLNSDYLKRFFKINKQRNQTLLLTNGYSFTLFNRILTKQELYQLELTWAGHTQFYQRKTRPKEKNKIDFFFQQFLNNSSIYQYRKRQIEILFNN